MMETRLRVQTKRNKESKRREVSIHGPTPTMEVACFLLLVSKQQHFLQNWQMKTGNRAARCVVFQSQFFVGKQECCLLLLSLVV